MKQKIKNMKLTFSPRNVKKLNENYISLFFASSKTTMIFLLDDENLANFLSRLGSEKQNDREMTTWQKW